MKITQSMIRTMDTCLMKLYLSYILGIKSAIKSDALVFGNLIHDALETYYTNDHDLEKMIELVETSDIAPDRKIMAKVLLHKYHEIYPPFERIIEAEQNFSVDIDGVTFNGIRDLMVVEEGQIVLYEHKTTSVSIDLSSDYWGNVLNNPQLIGYHLACEIQGIEPLKCRYNVIRKPSMKLAEATPIANRKYKTDGTLYANQREFAETLAEYEQRLTAYVDENWRSIFVRHDVYVTESDKKYFIEDLKKRKKMLDIIVENDIFPKSSNSCHQYGECEFYGLCWGNDEITDVKYKTKTAIHEELSEEEQDEI